MAEFHTCKTCQHRTRHGNCKEPVAAGLADRFIIVWPPVGYGQTCGAWRQKTYSTEKADK